MGTAPRKTRRAWNEPGHGHFLTYSCVHRWPLLHSDRSRQWVVDALAAAREHLHLQVWAYVIMPEHVHVVLLPPPECPMHRVLANLKHPVAKWCREWLRAAGRADWLAKLTVHYPSRSVFRFWEPGGGFDHNLWHDKALKAVIEYLHRNPVRRGLVADPLDWPWSSARFWEGHDDVPLCMDLLD